MDMSAILRDSPLFKNLIDDSQLQSLLARAREVRFKRGDVLMRERELGSSMFIIVTGKVEVSVHEPGGDQVAAELGPGEIVGEMSLVTGERRTATVRAKGRVTAVEIDKPALASIITPDSDFAMRLAGVVEQRHAELLNLHRNAGRWVNVTLGASTIAARMRAFYTE